MKIIEINLLPPEYKPPSPYSFRNIAIFAISLLVAIFLILLVLLMVNLKNKYNNEYKQLTRNIEIYGKQKQEIEKLKKREAALNQRRNMLMELIGQRFTWYDKLINLYEQIPENLWLSSISVERQEIEIPKIKEEKDKSPPTGKPPAGKPPATTKKKPPATKQTVETASQQKGEAVSPGEEKNVQQIILLNISGDAMELQQISKFIASLDESSSFEKTKLLSIGQNEKEGRSVMSFEIATQLTKP
jgi:Tfp pilus assembly protein PilN